MVKRCITGILLMLAVVFSPVLTIYADGIEYHEDPETAGEIFSSISLLQYYSNSLDTILQINPEKTESLLVIMPFANIPGKLNPSTEDFNNYSIALSYSIDEIDAFWQREGELLYQYLLDEAEIIRRQIIENLPRAYDELGQVTSSVEAIGSYLAIEKESSQSDLKLIYNEILDKLQRIEDMLDLFSRPLVDPEHLHDNYEPSQVMLTVEPLEAFVGDEINFTVSLYSNGKPLPGRNVVLALNGISYSEFAIDDQGNYRGKLELPYWYIPEIEIQAIYYPEGSDIGSYLGSVSRISNIFVKYYSCELELFITGQAYPGKSIALYGTIDYEDSPVMNDRLLNIHIDDNFTSNVITETSFNTPVDIPNEIALGNHTIIASSPAYKRYSPVISFLNITVSQAKTYLDLSLPNLCLIPGTISIDGELYSELGPLKNALITMEMSDKTAQSQSSMEGAFTGGINKGMEFSLLGYQQINIQIQPSEAWNAPLEVNRDIYVINVANLGIILAVLIILTIVLRVKIGKRSRWSPQLGTGLTEEQSPAPISLTKAKIGPDTVIIWNKHEKNSLYARIVDWYIRSLKIIAEITSTTIKPQQTIREYAEETSPKLGFLSQLFNEFTGFIERLLYSGCKPNEEDVAVSRNYSDAIRKERL